MRFNVWIQDQFFSDEDFNSLLEFIPSISECQKQKNREYSRSNFKFPCSHSIHSILKKYESKISLLVGLSCSFLPNVEYRVYQEGDKMDWHRDYNHSNVTPDLNPIFECVVTLINSSDSTTEYRDEKTQEITSITTIPNQCMVLVRQGIYHRVTPLTKGKRWICKFQFQYIGTLNQLE